MKKFIVLLVCVFVIGYIIVDSKAESIDVISSFSSGNEDVVNILCSSSEDVNVLRKTIISKYKENSFKSMLFSFDERDFPDILDVYIYKSLKDFDKGVKFDSFRYDFSTEQYNDLK